MSHIYLEIRDITSIYHEGKVKKGSKTFSFVKEIEGELEESIPNAYTSRFSRETKLIVVDENQQQYSAIVEEYGDMEEDMQIATGSYIVPISSKSKKKTVKKKN